MRNESLDAAGPSGNLLRVEFVWRGDRFCHVISAIGVDGDVVLLLDSLEGLDSLDGTAADDWPPSPPLQSLHRETLAGGRQALLLVGAAGRSHWSASVEAGNDPATLTFDIACRAGGAAAQLGSEYFLLPKALELLRIQPHEAEFVLEGNRLRIAPRSIVTPTVRWRYSIRSIEHNQVQGTKY